MSLDVSPKKFKDNTPEKDRNNPFAGFSVTNKEALSSELPIEVTNAIIADFSTNALFKEISRRIDNPDFVMKGQINKFVGKSRMTTFGIVSMFTYVGVISWYFGTPIRANETEMELIVSLYNSKEELIGTYTGKYKDKILSSMYKNTALALPSQTNKSFSNAISQIRDQILNDINKYD